MGFEAVADAVADQSVDLPGGTIKSPGKNIRLRSLGQARTGAAFEEIVVKTKPDGTAVRVKDLATVTDGFSEDDGFLYYNGEKAVGIQVFRSENGNTLTIADQVRQYVSDRTLPSGVSLDVVADMSVHLKNRLVLMVQKYGHGQPACVYLPGPVFKAKGRLLVS